MSRLEISDGRAQKSSIGVAFGIKPRWWQRAMISTADILWNCHLTRASWAIADLCLWLQKETRKRNGA